MRCRPEAKERGGGRRAFVRVPQRGMMCVPRQVELARPAFFGCREGSPSRERKDQRIGAAFSLVTFSWPRKRKSPAAGLPPANLILMSRCPQHLCCFLHIGRADPEDRAIAPFPRSDRVQRNDIDSGVCQLL